MTLTPAQQALLAARLQGRRSTAAQPIPTAPPGPAPLSAEQEQMLLHGIFSPASVLYNEVATLERTGPLDPAALGEAIRQLARRHGAWRTTYGRTARRWTQTVSDGADLELQVCDLRDGGDPVAAVTPLVLAPYDVTTGPLVRPQLLRLADDRWWLVFALHHLAFDGVSLGRVVGPELVALYDGLVTGSPAALPPAVQYADYATWRADGVASAELAERLPWWRRRLQGSPSSLALEHGGPRRVEARHRGAATWFAVEPAEVARLRARGAADGASLVTVLLAAYARVLGGLGADTDGEVVVGTVVDLRRRPELAGMLGYCLTPVPLRLPTTGDVTAAREELLGAVDHVVPFGSLTAALDPPREPGANPLFQTMLVLQPTPRSPGEGWELLPLDRRLGEALCHAKVDVMVELAERPDGGLTGRVVRDVDLIPAETAERLVDDYLALLRAG